MVIVIDGLFSISFRPMSFVEGFKVVVISALFWGGVQLRNTLFRGAGETALAPLPTMF